MGKHLLQMEYDYNFLLVGISSHVKDYRICWAINKKLEMNLQKEEDLLIKTGDKRTSFSLYQYENQDNYTIYYMIANRGTGGQLIPEHRQADYFFIAKGPQYLAEKDDIVSKLREISFVNTAYEVNPESLKSKENLMF